MTRSFIYARVSTTDQTTDNQLLEIANAGFAVEPHRIITESISGSVPADQRPQFAKLLDRMEPGDVLIVTKLDRLGRNAMDVRGTVERLTAAGVRVYCLQLGGVDLTSAAGKMTMGVLAACAEFELDQLKERTVAGVKRARAAGKTLGRPAALTPAQQADVRTWLAEGATVYGLAKQLGVTRQSIMRARDKAPAAAA